MGLASLEKKAEKVCYLIRSGPSTLSPVFSHHHDPTLLDFEILKAEWLLQLLDSSIL